MKRVLSILLVCVLLLAMLSACREEQETSRQESSVSSESKESSKNNESSEADEGIPDSSHEVSDEQSEESSQDVSQDEHEEKPPLLEFPLEKKHYDATVTILTREDSPYLGQFAAADESESALIDKAVSERNHLIKSEYGIAIDYKASFDPVDYAVESVLSGTDSYDIISDTAFNMVKRTTDGVFWDLRNLLELNRPWWDQSIIHQLHLSDEVFFVTGDMILSDDLYLAAVLFNKDAYKEQLQDQYGSLYDLVDGNEWTIDLMAEMARAFVSSASDATYSGIVSTGFTGATMLTYGCGGACAYKESAGKIVLSVGSEASVRAFDKVFALMKDSAAFDAGQSSPTDPDYSTHRFTSGRALFQIGYIEDLKAIADKDTSHDVSVGIVPLPKYDATQTNYLGGVHLRQSDVLAIPISNVENLEATVYAMELLGYYSMPEGAFGENGVTSVLYQAILNHQPDVDRNDLRMLEQISETRFYDIGAAFNWGGNLIDLYYNNYLQGYNALVTNWESTGLMVKLMMEDYLEEYSQMYE